MLAVLPGKSLSLRSHGAPPASEEAAYQGPQVVTEGEPPTLASAGHQYYVLLIGQVLGPDQSYLWALTDRPK